MTHKHSEVPRHHWLIRYYRAQLGFQLHVFTALRIIPAPIAAAGSRGCAVPKSPREETP